MATDVRPRAFPKKKEPKPNSSGGPPPERALSVLQPWAWALASGFKTLENRKWSTDFRGRIAIHASSSARLLSDSYADDMCEYLYDVHPKIFNALDDPRINPMRPILVTGGIIGTVDIVDCIPFDPAKDDPDKKFAEFKNYSTAPEIPHGVWAQGPYCFVCANPRRFRHPIGCLGKLNLWKIPADLQEMIADSDRHILKDPGEPTVGQKTYEPDVRKSQEARAKRELERTKQQ